MFARGRETLLRADAVVLGFGVCALFSGAALLASVYFHQSLGLTLAALGVFAVATAGWTWLRIPLDRRAPLRRLALSGAVCGIAATLAYDAVRFALSAVFNLHVHPYDALPTFGHLILGSGVTARVAFAAGFLYHEANGLLFGTAYAFIVGPRGWLSGVVWGLGLELLMLLVYPGLLHIRALLAEFTVLSLSGHLGYGFVLGSGLRWLSRGRA